MNPPLNDSSRFPKKSPKWLWLLLAALAVAAVIDVFFFFRSRNGDYSDRGTLDGHEYVDLGLSVKWATCNIGAISPEEFGDYFAWGETKPKKEYNAENYRFYKTVEKYPSRGGTSIQVTLSKYNEQEEFGVVDNKNCLDLVDDAAYVNWGTSWRMPTKKEFDELVKKCSWEWVNLGGISGFLVTSKKNKQSIFLPETAEVTENSFWNFDGTRPEGLYWTSTLSKGSSDVARYIHVIDNEYYPDRKLERLNIGCARYVGMAIRPVTTGKSVLVEQVIEEIPVAEVGSVPFDLVEQKPSFNGGDANEFSKWVNTQLIYPEIAIENGIEGRVTLEFTVEPDGSVTNVKVLRGVDESLDKEAVRVVSSSPKWTPGNHQGRPVRVTYTFPIDFQLR